MYVFHPYVHAYCYVCGISSLNFFKSGVSIDSALIHSHGAFIFRPIRGAQVARHAQSVVSVAIRVGQQKFERNILS